MNNIRRTMAVQNSFYPIHLKICQILFAVKTIMKVAFLSETIRFSVTRYNTYLEHWFILHWFEFTQVLLTTSEKTQKKRFGENGSL